MTLTIIILIFSGTFTNAFKMDGTFKELSESDKMLQNILDEIQKCQKESHEIIEDLKKELKNLQEEINTLKLEKESINDIKDIIEDVEILKRQMVDRQIEIGILQDHDFEKDQKIQDIEEIHKQDINGLSNQHKTDINAVSNNITEVKNGLSKTAPIGTILAWSPIPAKGTEQPVSIPICWAKCNGSLIKEGLWTGKPTPDLNMANR